MRKSAVALAVALGSTLILGLSGCIGTDAPPVPLPATATATGEPSTEPSPNAESCQDDFSATIEWDREPTVPHVAYVALTNEGEGECSLAGFPSEVEYVDASGAAMTLGYEGHSVDGHERAGTTVTVAPGDQAYVWTWIIQTANRNNSEPCEFPALATGLSLTLPGATAPVIAPAGVEVCLDDETEDVEFGPVDGEPRPASTGY